MNSSTPKVRPHMDALENKPSSTADVINAVAHDYPGQVVLYGSDQVCTRCHQPADPLYGVANGRICSTCLCPPAQKCERCA